MKTTVEHLEDFQKKVTVTLEASEVTERINKQYKDYAYKYNFPGFRKGKAPRPIIDSMLGADAVRAAVTDDILNNVFPLAMDEQDLVAIGQAQVDDVDQLVTSGEDFTFSATVPCYPEFELSNYDKVSVKLPSVEASEEEVDTQIEELMNYYYTFEDASASKKLADGGFADIAMSATDADGNAIVAFATDNRLYEVGSGLFPEEFDKAIIGMKKGESKTFDVDMTQPSMMSNGLTNPGNTTFTVEVKQVKNKVMPELTDEWVKETAGFENVADLRERIAENVKTQKEQLMPRLRETEALYALQERLQGEAPEGLCESEEQQLLQNFFMQVQQSGMTFDAYLATNGLTAEQFQADLKKQARDVAEQDLALDAWARHAGFEITDEDISAEFEKSGTEDPKALEKEWREQGRIAMLRQGIRRTRAIEAILDDLEVEELAPGEKLPDHTAAAEEESKKSSKKKSGAKSSKTKDDDKDTATADDADTDAEE